MSAENESSKKNVFDKPWNPPSAFDCPIPASNAGMNVEYLQKSQLGILNPEVLEKAGNGTHGRRKMVRDAWEEKFNREGKDINRDFEASKKGKYQEKDEPLVKEGKQSTKKRPPKEWFDKMAAKVKAGNPSYSKEQVAATVGQIWYHRISPKKVKQIKRRVYGTKMAASLAPVLELMEYGNDLLEMAIPIPALVGAAMVLDTVGSAVAEASGVNPTHGIEKGKKNSRKKNTLRKKSLDSLDDLIKGVEKVGEYAQQVAQTAGKFVPMNPEHGIEKGKRTKNPLKKFSNKKLREFGRWAKRHGFGRGSEKHRNAAKKAGEETLARKKTKKSMSSLDDLVKAGKMKKCGSVMKAAQTWHHPEHGTGIAAVKTGGSVKIYATHLRSQRTSPRALKYVPANLKEAHKQFTKLGYKMGVPHHWEKVSA